MEENPVSHLIANLGDANPFEYGGYLILKDGEDFQGVYWDEPQEDETSVMVYRFSIEPNAIKDLSWVKDKDWKSVADTHGTTKSEILAMAKSPKVRERAEVYRMVAGHFGWENLDSYPDTINLAKLDDLYGSKLDALKHSREG
jgi:hypothetical protein